jgi:hypothetical protein
VQIAEVLHARARLPGPLKIGGLHRLGRRDQFRDLSFGVVFATNLTPGNARTIYTRSNLQGDAEVESTQERATPLFTVMLAILQDGEIVPKPTLVA